MPSKPLIGTFVAAVCMLAALIFHGLIDRPRIGVPEGSLENQAQVVNLTSTPVDQSHLRRRVDQTSTNGAAPTSTRVTESITNSHYTIARLLRTSKDLPALYESLANDQSAHGKTLRALILSTCADAARTGVRNAFFRMKHDVVPKDVPYADRREAARLYLIETSPVGRCGAFLNPSPTSDQIQAAFQEARLAGSDHAQLAFLIKEIESNAKAVQYKAQQLNGEEEVTLRPAPNGEQLRKLLSLLASPHQEVQEKAFRQLVQKRSDSVLELGGVELHALELGWAWHLSRCDLHGGCDITGQSLVMSCYIVPDDCRFPSVEAQLRAQFDSMPRSLGADWSRVEQLRAYLIEAARTSDYSRFNYSTKPPSRGRPWTLPYGEPPFSFGLG